MQVKPENFIMVPGWMVTDCNLSGHKLLCAALLNGFSQDGKSEFTGSIAYIQEWLGCSRQTVFNTLAWLEEVGIVQKREYMDGGVKRCAYRVVKNLDQSKNLTGLKIRPDQSKNLTGTGQKIRPNNIDNINNIYTATTTAAPRTDAGLSAIIQHYQAACGTFPRSALEELRDYMNRMETSLIMRAVDIAEKAGARNWSYISTILRRWDKTGIYTLAAQKAEETERDRKKQRPAGRQDGQPPGKIDYKALLEEWGVTMK